MSSALSRLGVAAGVALFLFVGFLLVVLPGQGQEEPGSVFSTEPGGLRALFLLCEGLGLRAEPWSDAPGELAGRGACLFVSELPEAPPEGPPAGADEETARTPRRSRDLGHYRRFLEEGGTLLIAGAGEAELDFARDDLALAGLDGISSEAHAFQGTGVWLAGSERLELGEPPDRRFTGEGAIRAEALARAADDSILALVVPALAGRVLLLAPGAELFANSALEEHPDRALLFVRLLEALAPLERVLFDEYALGGWTPASRLALAFSPRLAWLSAHLVLVLTVLLWRSAWAGPFARDPEPLLAASPLFRAAGTGRTLARAGRWDVLARLLLRGALERWDARLGLRAPLAADGTTMEPEALERNLRELARGDEALLARMREAFLERRPADEHALARLDADLRALEGELFAADPRKRPRGLGAHRPPTGS